MSVGRVWMNIFSLTSLEDRHPQQPKRNVPLEIERLWLLVISVLNSIAATATVVVAAIVVVVVVVVVQW